MPSYQGLVRLRNGSTRVIKTEVLTSEIEKMKVRSERNARV